MSKFFALDPGNVSTGYVVFDGEAKVPLQFGKILNEEILGMIPQLAIPVVCEFPYPRGQTVAWQTFEACETYGRFRQQADLHGLAICKINRDDVKRHLCKSSRAKDKHVRAALIERYGGPSSIAGGKCPVCKGKGGSGPKGKRVNCANCNGTGQVPAGILKGFSADAWQALGVAATFADLGPSKTAAQLQVDRKDRKLQQLVFWKEKVAAMHVERESTFNAQPATPKQKQARMKRLISLGRNIETLERKIAKSRSPIRGGASHHGPSGTTGESTPAGPENPPAHS